MFDFGKFLNDIGNNVNSFFNPKKKKDEEALSVTTPTVTPATTPGVSVTTPKINTTPQLDIPSSPVKTTNVQVTGPNVAFSKQNSVQLPEMLKTPQQKQNEKVAANIESKLTPKGTIVDSRPYPARVPNDSFAQANTALEAQTSVKDVGNYYKVDADNLRKELLKPNPDAAMVKGLTQSLSNRKAEIEKMNSTMSEDERFDFAKKAIEDRGGSFNSGRNDAANFVGEVVKAPFGLVTKPAGTVAYLANQDAFDSSILDMDTRYREGKISYARLQEEFKNLTGDMVAPLYQNKNVKIGDNGIEFMGKGDQIKQFAGSIVQQGVDSYVGGGTALKAGLTAGEKVGELTVKQILKDSLKQGLKESAVTGTAQTGADLLLDKGVSPESLLANYGIDAVLNVGGEATGQLIRKAIKPQQVKDATNNINQQLRASGSLETMTEKQVQEQMVQEATQQVTDAQNQVAAKKRLTDRGVTTFAPLDGDSATKVDSLITQSEAQPPADGYTRLFQTNDGADIVSDQFFKDPSRLANYINGRSENATLSYQDVPNAQVQATPGKPDVFRIGETIPEETTQKPGAFNNIIEEIEARRKNPTSLETPDLAKENGVQQTTVDRLNRLYGEQATKNILASTSDATGIRNKDAFVTAEANRRYGRKTEGDIDASQKAEVIDNAITPKSGVKIVRDGTDITADVKALDEQIAEARANGDTQKASDLQMQQMEKLQQAKIGDEKVETPAQQVAGSTNLLPDSTAAGADDIPRIEQTMQDTQTHVTGFGESTTPEARTKMMTEIAEHERNGTAVSPESKALYNEYIKPVVDAMYDKSKRSQAGELGRKEFYLPEEITGREKPTFSPFGRGWIDESNLDFGHAKERKGAIDTADLNDPVNSLHNYIEQFYYDNYGHLSPENIAEARGRGVENPVDYLQGRQAISEKVDKSVIREVNLEFANNKENLKNAKDIVGDIQKNFDKNGGDPGTVVELDSRMPAAAQARTNRKISQKISAGNQGDAYSAFGMREYESATPQANKAFAETFNADMDLPEYAATLRGYYEPVYNSTYADIMSKTKFDNMVDSAAMRSLEDQNPLAIAKLERNLAIEKAIYSSEHIRFSDPKVQAQINREVTHMLRDGKYPQTIARKITDQFTKMMYSGALGLNPISAVQNLTELSRVAGLTSGKDTLKTLKAQISSATIPQIRETLQQYGVNSSRIQQELDGKFDVTPKNVARKGVKIAGKAQDKVNDFAMAGFNATDAMKNFAMLKALEIKHAGISDVRVRQQKIIDDFNSNSLLGGHYGNIEGVNRSNFTRAALQFGSYTMRDWGQIAEMAGKGDWGYVARTLGTRAALAVPLYGLFGMSLAYTLGVNEYKGGPIISIATNAYQAYADEAQRVQDEIDKGNDATFDWANVRDQLAKKQGALLVTGGNYLFNKLGVQDLSQEGRDLSFLRHDTAIGDMQRGYNENADGRPRFSAPGDGFSTFKSIIGGAYNSTEAGNYFGKGFLDAPKLYGVFDTNTQKYTPVNSRYQEAIEKQSGILQDPVQSETAKRDAQAEIGRLFSSAYDDQDLKQDFFKKNPNAQAIYKDMTKTTINPATHKLESDVITPEKWNFVQSEKSGELFNFLKDRAVKNNQEFGDPIDPIYKLTDSAQVKEALALRASYTGDDGERKAILNKDPWYQQYVKDQAAYYEAKGDFTADPDSPFGSSERATQYYALTAANPAFEAPKSDVLTQYEAIRESGDEEARKAFYKANIDTLGAEYEQRSNAQYDWTNKMRALEGVQPIPKDTWDNASYGYTDDEAKLLAELKAKDYAANGGGSSSPNAENSSFGKAGGTSPNITVKKGSGAKINRKKQYKKAAIGVKIKKK